MTTIRVDSAEVAELGVALAETGADLLRMGDPAADRWALGPGDAGPAVEELLGGWRRVRLALGGSLTELGEAAVAAGRSTSTPSPACRGRCSGGPGDRPAPAAGTPGRGPDPRRPPRRDVRPARAPSPRSCPVARRRHLGGPGRWRLRGPPRGRRHPCWMPSLPASAAPRRRCTPLPAPWRRRRRSSPSRAARTRGRARVCRPRGPRVRPGGDRCHRGRPGPARARHLQREQVEPRRSPHRPTTRPRRSGSVRPTARCAGSPGAGRRRGRGPGDLPPACRGQLCRSRPGDRGSPSAAAAPARGRWPRPARRSRVSADAALLVAYDEGDCGDLGGAAPSSATGGAGAALRRRRRPPGRSTRARGAVSTRHLTAHSGGPRRRPRGPGATRRRAGRPRRLAGTGHPERPDRRTGGQGARGGARGRDRPASPSAGRARAGAARARAATTAGLDRAFRDDWRLATANGPAAQRLLCGRRQPPARKRAQAPRAAR